MAEASQTPKQANPVPNQGDHDRVAMLSLKADGTPDQHNPEIIGDKEFAVAAAKRQFAEQAVSAADVASRAAAAGAPTALVGQPDGGVEEKPAADLPQDPSIADAAKEHEKVAKAAESAAEKAISSLHKG